MSSRSCEKDRSYRIKERSSYRRFHDKDQDKNFRERSRSSRNNLDLDDLVSLSDRDIVNERLNEEMQKRREKVERWRQQRRKSENPISLTIDSSSNTTNTWSLDKDDDDEGDEKTNDKDNLITLNDSNQNNTVDEEVDPLDVYMSEINKLTNPTSKQKKVKIVLINKTTNNNSVFKKGDIVETEEDHDQLVDDFDIGQAASSLLAKGRQLPQTNHEDLDYPEFRKDFYIEVPEIAKMSKKEVEDYRAELDDIKVRGSRCPKPIKNWAQCGVDLKILNNLKKYGYIKPTPIQAQAIPSIMSGRDVIGIAKTGSGKTLGFLLPMFRHILDQPPLKEMDGPIAIIMSPTRELAMQTWKEANKFAISLRINVVCVYGGVGISDQIADLKKGAEVIVCTPGRMIDMLAANNGNVTNLRRVTYLVLDEADRMFDMGFEPQVMKIVNNIRPDRQTVLFSATMPKQMEALGRKILQRPIEIQVGGKSVVCNHVEQHALIIEEQQKFLKLLELLGTYGEKGNVLVFVDKQEKADDLVAQLIHKSYSCAPLHGGIDQFDRDSTISDFKMGRIKLMVATSVAARGLDVKKLILVVNYDCPNHYEDYVHRVGRTGRAGNKGYSYTFLLPEGQEKMAGEVCRAFETAGATPPIELKKMWEDYKESMKAKGIEVHVGGGGFSGSGFKYDEEEDEAEANRRKMTKLVHGIETAMEDDDEEIEAQLTSMMKSSTRVVKGKAFHKPNSFGAKAAAVEAENKLAVARAAAEKIAAAKQLNYQAPIEKDATSLTAEAIMKGHEATPVQLSAASIAKQKAVELNERLNYLPSQMLLGDDEEQQAQYFEEELEINSFPQQLRYRVCSRESIAQVQEFADVSISVKGTHYPPGKEPKDCDRKLYLLLEARDEVSLRRAKEEILRIMRETLRQMTATGANRLQFGGRYKVL